jgi:hypothetical protein
LRDGNNLSKKIKSVAMDNQFIAPHEKNNLINQNRPSKSHQSSVDRYDSAVTESLKRINDLIKKII